jgi:hypothetical protein
MADEQKQDPRDPGKRYHQGGATCYVQNAAEDKKLGAGWFDSPKAAAAAAQK